MQCFYSVMDSPCGPLRLVLNEGGSVRGIDFAKGRTAVQFHQEAEDAGWILDEEKTADLRRQLEEYFAGKRQSFDLRLAPEGTEFQRQVWAALEELPFGTTTSYGVLARDIGRPKASRAVGAANGANPIPIVVPCHRVIGANGSLTGFGGGLKSKKVLLELEGLSVAEGPRQLTLSLSP